MDATLKTVSYAIPACITVLTIPVIWNFAKSIWKGKVIKEDEVYEDADGKATEESMKNFLAQESFVLKFLGVALGAPASFALAVIATIDEMHIKYVTIIWLLFWSWVSEFPIVNEAMLMRTDLCAFTSRGCLSGDSGDHEIS